MRLFHIVVVLMLSGCVQTGGVMEADGGTYLISARAAPAAGGTAGANKAAYEQAQKFCGAKGQRPIVVTAAERDVYQSAGAASWGASGGSVGGGTFAGGNANLRFRCDY